MKRRTVLLSAAGTMGALVVGWGALPQRSRLGAGALMLPLEGEIALNGWIKIAKDGAVVLAMPRSEMGQGVHTALAMLAAEELVVPLSAVRLEQAGADSIYGNIAMLMAALPFHPKAKGQAQDFGLVKASYRTMGKLARELGINATAGSSTIADLWDVVRLAAATARVQLLRAAAERWQVPVAELSFKAGVVDHPSGKSANFAQLVGAAAEIAPGEVWLKPRGDWRLIGKSPPRIDVPAKVDGSARFGIDVRMAGLKYAAVRMCPMLGGTVSSIDAKAALVLPGVQRVVMLPADAGSTAGFAVVGDTYWHAQQAALAVAVQWQQREGGAVDSRRALAVLTAAVREQDGFAFFTLGDVGQAEQQSASQHEAWYQAPFLAHAAIEPMNCTAKVLNGKVEIWVSTQVPQMAREIAAKVAGVNVIDVTVNAMLIGGGFGRRLEVDFVAQAVRVAKDSGGAPVQLIWSREEDTTHDFYRPAQVARLRAALDAQGKLVSLSIKSAGDAISPRWTERAVPLLSRLSMGLELPDKTTGEGLFDLPYDVPHQRMEHVATRLGVPVGLWRSVGHSHNAFFSESFIDELAALAREDSYRFRRKLLNAAPRHLAVLDLVAAKAQWGGTLPAGRARGIALHESFGSIVAQVAEVSLQEGRIRVHRVVCALDCGTVVHPDIVAQQMEGSVIFGLTAALHGRIDIHDGVVQQSNFSTYAMVTLAEAPVVETWLVPSERPPGGVGEPGVPPVAAAVANALFALTGKRLRSLPLAL